MGGYNVNMKNNIKFASLISYLTLLAGNIISLIYTPFMLATLGSSEYGLFTLVNSIIAYIYLLDMGLGNAVVRYNSKLMVENDEIGLQKINGMFFILYSIISLIALIIGIIIYTNLQNIFAKGLAIDEIYKVKIMFIIALINLVFSFPLNVFGGIITANERFVFVKLINLIRTVLNPIIMVLILLLGYKSIGMLITSTIFNLLLGVVNIVYCFKVLKTKMIFRGFDKNLYKEIFQFSFYIFLSAIAYKIYWGTDQVILGMFVSASSISIYSIGLQFNNYFTSFSNVISGMFLPQLTKLAVKEKDNNIMMDILIKVSRIQAIISLFILSGFILIGKYFIEVWVGSNYNISYYIALIVMIPQIISIIQSLFATMLEAMNKHKVKAFIYLFVSIINLIITLILVNILGAIGCAIGTAIGMIINAIINNIYYVYTLKLDMKYYWKEMGKVMGPIFITLFIGVILVMFIKPYSYIRMGIFVILYSIIYFGVNWIITFNDYEKDILISMTRLIKRNRCEVK